MGFHSNAAVSKIVGFIAATLALLGIAVALTFGNAGTRAALLALGAALAIASAAAFTYRRSVIIDSRRTLVATTRRMFFWVDTRHFGFSDFHAVGVTQAGGSDSPSRSSGYYVQLVGPVKLAVPGTSVSYEHMHSRARRISEVLNLPLEAGPKP